MRLVDPYLDRANGDYIHASPRIVGGSNFGEGSPYRGSQALSRRPWPLATDAVDSDNPNPTWSTGYRRQIPPLNCPPASAFA